MNKIILISLTLLVMACNSSSTSEESSLNLSKDQATILADENNTKVIKPQVGKEGLIVGKLGGCGYNNISIQKGVKIYEPRKRELDQVKSILRYSGLGLNFKVYGASIENAVAAIIDNERYIFYDPELLSYVDDKSGEYWSSMSILAHEIGHHLSGHTLAIEGSNPKSELEADKYSGFVMYKLGASLQQSLDAINHLTFENGTSTHPSKKERVKAITEGWREAKNTRYDGAIPPPPDDNINDFQIYRVEDLVDSELLNHEAAVLWYGEYHFLYGIVTEVSEDLKEAKVFIVKSTPSFAADFRDIKEEEWDIYLDQTNWGGRNQMSHVGSANLPFLMVPGRRIKFSMVEAYPGAGSAMNGVWFFTYLEALEDIPGN